LRRSPSQAAPGNLGDSPLRVFASIAPDWNATLNRAPRRAWSASLPWMLASTVFAGAALLELHFFIAGKKDAVLPTHTNRRYLPLSPARPDVSSHAP